MTDGLISDEAMKVAVPMQRAGTLEDVAGITLFLASKVRNDSFGLAPPNQRAITDTYSPLPSSRLVLT